MVEIKTIDHSWAKSPGNLKCVSAHFGKKKYDNKQVKVVPW